MEPEGAPPYYSNLAPESVNQVLTFFNLQIWFEFFINPILGKMIKLYLMILNFKKQKGLKKTFVICAEKEMLILVGRKSGAESEANVPNYMKRVKER